MHGHMNVKFRSTRTPTRVPVSVTKLARLSLSLFLLSYH